MCGPIPMLVDWWQKRKLRNHEVRKDVNDVAEPHRRDFTRMRHGEIDMSVKMRTTCTWTERPYEASLFPGIGFGPFLRSLGGKRRRPPSGGARATSEIPLWKGIA
ncbi:hypothetical protein H5410_030604 [Solanum commersonii]|uniref:Uncharacterized protein n=1 Tax=Solanum commersonii TaxID=4109 RepID=A0A9J5YG39_SOLCO|nr:hypothetical protein H5410_030604 [Solanum commersonii]